MAMTHCEKNNSILTQCVILFLTVYVRGTLSQRPMSVGHLPADPFTCEDARDARYGQEPLCPHHAGGHPPLERDEHASLASSTELCCRYSQRRSTPRHRVANLCRGGYPAHAGLYVPVFP